MAAGFAAKWIERGSEACLDFDGSPSILRWSMHDTSISMGPSEEARRSLANISTSRGRAAGSIVTLARGHEREIGISGRLRGRRQHCTTSCEIFQCGIMNLCSQAIQLPYAIATLLLDMPPGPAWASERH